jgi:hypothetical protein
MNEEIKSLQAELKSIVNAWMADMKDDRKATLTCQVTMAACLDSKERNLGDMKSEVEHREVTAGVTAVKS